MSQTVQGPTRQGEAEILLESGTNELEVLVFSVGEGVFGVNVAKVREVILPVPVAAAPHQHACVLGMFNLRGGLLPLIDLHKYLQMAPLSEERRIIVTEFNGVRSSFQVEKVEQIYRMNWNHMKAVPETDGNSHFAVTGITEIDGRLILMLDFESIVDHISMEDKLHVEKVENELGVDRSRPRIVLAEDSKFIRGIMERVLKQSGYSKVQSFSNGLDAWTALQGAKEDEVVVITDVEMPRMDGLHLTRRLKQDKRLGKMPVILFSSLITDDTRHKGEQVGADEQIAKPELPNLVHIVDRWVHKMETGKPA
ncbi:MAG: chemotaxis protein CheV [Phycisphaeraceae bacterium]|nr:chemotaxis protein CheV [Phycisphaeraceae bacterium]